MYKTHSGNTHLNEVKKKSLIILKHKMKGTSYA